MCFLLFFFFKQKTAYEMRISDWSSDVCSSDLPTPTPLVPKTMGGSAAAPAPAQPAKAAAPRPAPEPMPSAVVADSTRGQLSIATDPLPDFLTSRAQGPKADPFTPVELTFSWELLSAAAAFRRGAHLWLVFDRPAPRGVAERIADQAPHLGEVRLLEESGATILLIRALPTVAPRLSRDGNRWTVDLRPDRKSTRLNSSH